MPSRSISISLLLLFFYLLSCVPIPIGIGNSSIFDLFLPFLVIYTLSKYGFRASNIYITAVYILSATLLFLKTIDTDNTISVLGWIVRLFLFFSPLVCINLAISPESAKKSYPFSSKLSLWLPHLFALLSIVSVLHYLSVLRPSYWAIGFPIYSNGLDPHVFGPALSLIVVFTTHLIFSRDSNLSSYNKSALTLSLLICFSASLFSASRGAVAIYFAAIFFYTIRAIAIASITQRLKRRLTGPFISITTTLLLSFWSIKSISAFVSDPESPLFRATLRLSRIETIFSTIINPSDDPSRGQKVTDLISYLIDPNYWLVGSMTFMPVYDSGIILFYLNFGLLILLILYLLYINLIIRFFFANPVASCLLFCAIVHFTLASEALLIPRYTLVLDSLILFSTINKARKLNV